MRPIPKLPHSLNRALTAAVLLGLLASRRWQQIAQPQVWAEEGTRLVAQLADLGWGAFAVPVNGYLVTVPKAITALALQVSVTQYPLLAALLTWALTLAVGLAVAGAPTTLRWPTACAAAIFLVPTSPEVFGVTLYTFWWCSLLLFLLVLWDETRPQTAHRLIYLAAGGLSSPVIIALLPVLYLRSWIYRRHRAAHVVSLAATAVAAIQLRFILGQAESGMPAASSIAAHVVPKFFGFFVIRPAAFQTVVLWGAGLSVAGILLLWMVHRRRTLSAWFMGYLLVMSIALTAARVDPAVLHPLWAGPRYFFFPYVMVFWMLIQAAADRGAAPLFRAAAGVAIAAAALNAIPVWSRGHDDLRWQDHIYSCARFETYSVPVQYDGNRMWAWSVDLPGRYCREMIKKDPFAAGKNPPPATYPYRIEGPAKGPLQGQPPPDVVDITMGGTDYQRSQIPGMTVIGSFERSDADVGTVTLALHRGSRILYRSGPGAGGQAIVVNGHEREFLHQLPTALDWVILSFDNAALPEAFSIVISDAGRRWGEWSAVAVPMRDE